MPQLFKGFTGAMEFAAVKAGGTNELRLVYVGPKINGMPSFLRFSCGGDCRGHQHDPILHVGQTSHAVFDTDGRLVKAVCS